MIERWIILYRSSAGFCNTHTLDNDSKQIAEIIDELERAGATIMASMKLEEFTAYVESSINS